MDNISNPSVQEHNMELPPGFRFHPTDEELITHYLAKKVVDSSFSAKAIAEIDMNKIEPWELPWKAKMGETDWYFFCVRDKKYPTGLRTNRATAAGYWKATGKDKEIFRGKCLVGMKKTLVFYRGRAPKGGKTNWVSHEYRLEGKMYLQYLPKLSKSDWVICRVFQKSYGGKKVQVSGIVRMNSVGNNAVPLCLPPLMDSFPSSGTAKQNTSEPGHVHCFSNSINGEKSSQHLFGSFNSVSFSGYSNPGDDLPQAQTYLSNALSWGQSTTFPGNYHIQGSFPVQDPSMLMFSLENYSRGAENVFKTEQGRLSVSQETGISTEINTEISSVVSKMENRGRFSLEDQGGPSTSVATVDLDCLWSY